MSENSMSLGEFLRHERERRGITIDQVASATKVGIRTLHSLEADHYHELPAKPFIRGFVTSYCRFIGADPKEVLTTFDTFISKKTVERPSRDSGHSGYAFEKKDGEQQSRTILTIAIVGFIVLGGVAMALLKPSLRHHPSSHIEKLRAAHGDLKGSVGALTPVAVTVEVSHVPSPTLTSIPAGPVLLQSPLASASPASDDSLAEEPVKEKKPKEILKLNQPAVAGSNASDPLDSGLGLKASEIKHKVALKVLADIWVRYQVDDRPIRKFIMRKDKVLILRGREGVRLQVSNPESVKFSYNGMAYDKMSQSKKTLVRQGGSTLFFPFESSLTIEKPFGNAPELEATKAPEAEPLTQEPSPTSSPSP